MAKTPTIEDLLKAGSKQWNNLRREGKIPIDHTGATFPQLYSANADLSGLTLIGTEWEKCDLSKVTFKDSDLSNSYFHGGRLQDCDFRGANMDGVTFERMKLLRCDFTGATGLEAIEFDEVDMDRVVGLDGEDAPPPPPPPAVGITSFTREQRAAAMAAREEAEQLESLPPFRPGDPPSQLLFRGLKVIANPPMWVLDVPGQRPPLPARMPPGGTMEHLYREAVKARIEGRRPVPDMEAVEKAKDIVRHGGADTAVCVMYLVEVGEQVEPSEAASSLLSAQLAEAMEAADPTSDVDPRITGSLVALQAGADALEHVGELRMRLAGCQLFMSLLEAGFMPENNWEEALEASDTAQDLAHVFTSGTRELLGDAFRGFAELPEELRLRRLGYLAEATAHAESAAGGESAA